MRASRSHSEGTAPERRCIATGATGPRATLIRFVVGPQGTIVPDIEGRLPGRGLWLAARRAVLADAARGQAFARAARQPVKVDADLAERTERLLVERCVALLALARRAGIAVGGTAPVKSFLGGSSPALVLDAGVLTAEEIGQAFGRDRVVRAAVGAGRLAERLENDLGRLAGLRNLAPSWTTGAQRPDGQVLHTTQAAGDRAPDDVARKPAQAGAAQNGRKARER